MRPISVLILAAGQGTRMVSQLPKVLHPLCGKPLVRRVLDQTLELDPVSVGVVIGHGGKEIIQAIGGEKRVEFVWQKEQKGSGHAVRQAASWIRKSLRKKGATVLILSGDTPLITAETLGQFFEYHKQRKNAATILTSIVPDPFGYGRIVKDSNRQVRRIVEEKDATPAEREIREINSGIYCFDAAKLLEALPKLKNDNAKKEYYLTDVIGYFNGRGYSMETFSRFARDSFSETLGVNTRAELAQAEQLLQQEILKRWMRAGVTILNPSATYIAEEAQIGADTLILPGTMILGSTRIGAGCQIGPNSYIEDSEFGEGVKVRASFVYGSKVGKKVQIGPFTHLRTGTILEDGAKVGNFSEIKKSRVGRGSKVSHLSYIGDATLGEDVNVGAGVITCNYDGKNKHATVIGKNSFIGSNVNLVAPVKVGAGALIGAGSTISKDVPADALAIARSNQIVKAGWVKKNRS